MSEVDVPGRAGVGRLLLLIAVVGLPAPSADAQVAPADTVDARVEEARRLRDAGEHMRAVPLLRAHLRENPEDAAALRLLATTLDAAGEVAAAREAFEAALRHYPDDPLLRLDYGELLVEMGAVAEAREILAPMLEDPAIPLTERADAHVLFGRMAREAGARNAAEAAFRRALALSPNHPSAMRMLRASYRERSPWVATRIANGSDDQPVRTFHSEISGGYPVFPWLVGDFAVGVRSFDGEASDETVPEALVGTTVTWDLLNLEVRTWSGAFRRTADRGVDWMGGGRLAFLGPGGLRIRVEGARRPYFLTAASLDSALAPATVGGAVGRPDAPGWAGDVTYARRQFEDDIRVEELTAWFLGPVFRRREMRVRLGYEFRGADASEITFVPGRGDPLPAEGEIPGRYAPIYTPSRLQSHSLRVELRTERPESFTGILEGGWGVFAEQEAPLLFASVPDVPGAGVGLQFERRSFEPWNLTGRVLAPLAPAFELEVAVGHRRTAFRGHSFLRIGGTFHHLPPGIR